MNIRHVLAAITGGAIFIAAGVAAAGDFATSARSDFFSPGEHQFYVWCPRTGNYMAMEPGRNAEDAQLRLYEVSKAQGQPACWPLWQGRLHT